MRVRLIKDEIEPIEIKQIENFEFNIGFNLPKEYKIFLFENNGAKVNYDVFRFKEPLEHSEDFIENEIHLLNFSSLSDLEDFGLFEEEENTNRKYINIASGMSGSECIYLSLNNQTYGQIYFADLTHDNRFIPIANNLEDFLNGFEIDPDYEE